MHLRSIRLAATLGIGVAGMIVLALAVFDTPARSADTSYGTALPAAKTHLKHSATASATSVLAGGCFWGMEAVFSHVQGVTDVVSGYAAGDRAHANYRDSSTGRYGDAEAVRITYDPSKIRYTDLLQIYFSVAHDPTQIDRQGPDRGPQYRSEIFAANADQARVAKAYIEQLEASSSFDRPIATQVSVGEPFFPAEAYHQNYAVKHPNSYYLKVNDEPKVEALRKRFAARYNKRFIDDRQSAQSGG
ncbi:peptide-methionine (S)-S-oxide reductase MsrA [Salinisphaera sp. SPP-AMP-43]|uniref:peptide-methionine (S)-S-oxide reductase MsrA n=1 Tax=Salinisphaera sp. SPP-AMP-43 TaxID=3121288 RepID=UPI003C6EA045